MPAAMIPTALILERPNEEDTLHGTYSSILKTPIGTKILTAITPNHLMKANPSYSKPFDTSPLHITLYQSKT